jgi:multidrug resistance efflux pump
MKRYGKFVLPGVATALAAFAVFHVVRASPPLLPASPPVEPARTSFGQTVAGAGIVEAWTENIAIGAPLPGIVLEVNVPVEQVGKTVTKGDPLFRVDDRQLLATLKYNQANLQAAKAQLAKLEAQPRREEIPPSEAKVQVAQANLAAQQDLARRANRLRPSGAMAEEDAVQRSLASAVARQQVAQAQAEDALLKSGAWQYDKDIARAAVAQAEAQVVQTQTDLDRVLVRAPRDGVILQVNVREGEYVGTPPGSALMVLGAIKDKVHVRVDIDEHDIPRFRKGAAATASPRGHPQIAYPLHYERVEPYVVPKKSLTGDNVERVDTRVLQVIYSLDTKDRPVYVGQQMDVFLEAPPSSPAEEPAASAYVIRAAQ